MTAEQLEELQRLVDSADNDTVDPYDGVSPYFAADLARSVIAAEKLVDALNLVKQLCNPGGDIECIADRALTAYREASK